MPTVQASIFVSVSRLPVYVLRIALRADYLCLDGNFAWRVSKDWNTSHRARRAGRSRGTSVLVLYQDKTDFADFQVPEYGLALEDAGWQEYRRLLIRVPLKDKRNKRLAESLSLPHPMLELQSRRSHLVAGRARVGNQNCLNHSTCSHIEPIDGN